MHALLIEQQQSVAVATAQLLCSLLAQHTAELPGAYVDDLVADCAHAAALVHNDVVAPLLRLFALLHDLAPLSWVRHVTSRTMQHLVVQWLHCSNTALEAPLMEVLQMAGRHPETLQVRAYPRQAECRTCLHFHGITCLHFHGITLRGHAAWSYCVVILRVHTAWSHRR